ncbi:MAG: hydratase [Gammaproteobacteria bacterium]|nr:hydratase [Gammaproteobacteria bacterium]MBU1416747.1 hydratase [Gammaproteobacteria bacterium]
MAYLDDFQGKRLSKGFGKDLTIAGAECARGKLIEALPTVLGKRVGYKAVFTNPESQKRFGVDGPAWGAMFGGMMLRNSTQVPADFGAKPRYEPDFIVVVKDAGLADAQTPLEAMAHISELVPFIELPDIMLDGKPTGAELIAINAAFRGGVLGPSIAVTADEAQALLDALASMAVVVGEERAGAEVGRARGNVLMGQPIEAAIWLAKALKRDGIELQPGDLLSLGGFLGSAPVKRGTTISVRYLGLPDNPVVTVHFD